MNKYYRYCFFCNKWLSEKEVNEVKLGEGNKTFNCSTCRKDLGDQIQIFKCPNHEDIILKVWGTLEGQNKEKVFFKDCPKENQQEKQPPETIGKRALWFIGGGIVLIGGLVLLIYWWFYKKKEDE